MDRFFIPLNRKFVKIYIILLVGILGFIVWNAFSKASITSPAVNGRIFLDEIQLKTSATPLDGDWHFVWNQLHSPETFPKNPQTFMSLPRAWNGFEYEDTKLPAEGTATFHLEVILPTSADLRDLAIYIPFIHSSYALYLGDDLISEDGKVASDPEEYIPSATTQLVPIKTQSDTLHLTLQVANFAYALGGVWQSPRFGNQTIIQSHHDKQLAFDLFTFGGLFIMGIYHIALFLMRPQVKSNLYFGLLCLNLGIKNLFTGAVFFYTLWPNASYELGLKFIHTTIFLSVLLLWFFLKELFKSDFPKLLGSILGWIVFAAVGVTLIFSSITYSQLMVPFWIITGVVVIFVLRGIYLAVVTKKEGAILILAGICCFIITVFHDIAIDFKLIQSVYITGAGFFIFIFSQSILLAVKFTNSFQKVENLTEDLLNTNSSLTRFVPSEYLTLLHKKSILEVNLGDSTYQEMTVFFSDIRSYTTLSEQMSPETNFSFINDYLGEVVKYIHQNDGMVNQYLGDGILALFAVNPIKSIHAAIQIQHGISKIRELGGFDLKSPIETGIGIHSGPVILGMMGTEKRMTPGVISDTVNTASRLEGLTKFFGAQIIVSESVLWQIDDLSEFSIRFLGKVTVKGKLASLKIFEILDGLSSELKDRKLQTQDQFEQGLESYFQKEFNHAVACFRLVLETNPEDLAAQIYLRNSEQYLQKGVSENWEGDLKMEIK